MTFGERLIMARERKGWTRFCLSKKSGTNPSSISQWEMNKHKPGGESLIMLCDALQVSADWLLGLPLCSNIACLGHRRMWYNLRMSRLEYIACPENDQMAEFISQDPDIQEAYTEKVESGQSPISVMIQLNRAVVDSPKTKPYGLRMNQDNIEILQKAGLI